MSYFFTIEIEPCCKDKHFLSFIDDEIASFLSFIDDKMATLSAQERDLQAQNTYKRRQNIAVGVRKPVFRVEVRPFEALPEYTGLFSVK